MTFCRRSNGPTTSSCNTNRLTVPRNMCTKFHKYISIFIQVTACTDGRMDRQTDRQSPGISLVFSSRSFVYVYPISTRLVLGDTSNRLVNKTIILYSNKLREYKNAFKAGRERFKDETLWRTLRTEPRTATSEKSQIWCLIIVDWQLETSLTVLAYL